MSCRELEVNGCAARMSCRELEVTRALKWNRKPVTASATQLFSYQCTPRPLAALHCQCQKPWGPQPGGRSLHRQHAIASLRSRLDSCNVHKSARLYAEKTRPDCGMASASTKCECPPLANTGTLSAGTMNRKRGLVSFTVDCLPSSRHASAHGRPVWPGAARPPLAGPLYTPRRLVHRSPTRGAVTCRPAH
jgi:hypothetical protein